ncbi:YciI family protein [Actinopolymorpha pittospori]
MRFLFLLYGDEQAEAALSPAERQMIVEHHMVLSERLAEEGRVQSGEVLQASTTARTLDRTSGSVTDGPYAETKEQLGGFYVMDCADMDDALALAREIPDSPGLRIEIRPVDTA